jgi:hypothetical protein
MVKPATQQRRHQAKASVAQDIRRSFDIILPDIFEQSYRARLLTAFGAGLALTSGVAAAVAVNMLVLRYTGDAHLRDTLLKHPPF